jgi:integrase
MSYMHPQDFLSKEDFAKLLKAARTPRERALLLVMAGCGLRVAETANLKAEDIDQKDGYIYVQGKGSKDRTVVTPAPVFEAITALNIDKGPLFPGYQSGHISTWEIAYLLDQIATIAGLQEKRPPEKGKTRQRLKITPHLLRHSYASWIIDMGGNVSDLQSQLGHSSLTITGLYLTRRPNHRRESFQRIGLDGIV